MFQPKCWSSLIMILGSSSLLEKSGHLHPLSLKEPPLDFQRVTETYCGTGEPVLVFVRDFTWCGHWLILLNPEVNFTMPRPVLLWNVPNGRNALQYVRFRSIKCDGKQLKSACSSVPGTDSMAFSIEMDQITKWRGKQFRKKAVQIVLKSWYLSMFFTRTEVAAEHSGLKPRGSVVWFG